MKKNVAGQAVGAQLIAKADGTPVTSGTTTISVTGDAGTQATGTVGSGACTHKGNGYWTYAPAQAETNFDLIAFTLVNTNAVNATIQIYTAFPQTGDNFARIGAPVGASISADVAAVKATLPSVAAGTSGGLPTIDAALNVSSLAVDSGTAQAGASTTITLRSGASATDNLYTGSVVTIYSGTGAGQSRVIVGYVGSTKVATVLRTWAITPDNTSVYKVHGLAVPKVDDNLAVTVQAGTGTGQLDVTAGVVKANPTQINGDGTSAANLASSTRAIARGTVGSGSTTTSIVTSACTPSGAVANQFVGRTVLFDGATTTTALRGQVASITASSNAAAPVFTVSTLTTAPASGDLFSIL